LLDRDEFRAWYRLLETPGVGRADTRRLLASFGSAQAVFNAPTAAWRSVVAEPVARALADEPPEVAARLDAALRWLDGGADRSLLSVGDEAYPPRLLQCPDPPLLLYVQGRVDLLARSSIAIVGSRNASVQGADNARAFAAALGRQGFAVVSGLALGIDAAAHEGALQADSGTIAVVGTGPDRVYPAANRALAYRIAAEGAIVSEFAPGTPPLPSNFPQRNRIIAGLARGTLVVEAALQSGSLITARVAADCGREVFAVPGSIHSPLSRGCHALLRQGAKLVESAQDVLDELGAGGGAATALAAASPARLPDDPLLEALGQDPVTLDALGARTGLSVQALQARLLELELEGRVARLPGGLFQRRALA
jgi:DNA processing protein